jgi:hypothetical protein
VPALAGLPSSEVEVWQCRTYIVNNYQAIRASPATITVRELEYVSPTIIATFAYGVETKVNLTQKTEAEIDQVIGELAAKSQKVPLQVKM